MSYLLSYKYLLDLGHSELETGLNRLNESDTLELWSIEEHSSGSSFFPDINAFLLNADQNVEVGGGDSLTGGYYTKDFVNFVKKKYLVHLSKYIK